MKPYYRIKGKYKDNRQRIVIEWKVKKNKKKSVSLPKPELLLEILLDTTKKEEITKENDK